VLIVLAAVVVWSTSPAEAGPCTADLDALQAQVDAAVEAAAASGKSAVESKAATSGHQPTPGSIAAAEARLGEGERARSAVAAMSDARAADAAGDLAECKRAIARVRSALQH